MEYPNLVCICLDTLRADIIDGMLSSVVHTPNLDAFVQESVLFTQAFGEGQPTLQMRRSAFTGQRSFPWVYNYDRRGHWHHAAGWHKIPPEQDTLAEILLKRGFMTGMVSDTYHMFKPTMNYARGFVTYDFIRGQENDNWRGASEKLLRERLEQHAREPVAPQRYPALVQYLANTQDREKEEDYFAARVFLRASDWLEENRSREPFFLWVDSFDPHEPWDPPLAYADRYYPGYDGKDFIFPPLAYEKGQPTDEELERIKALYFGEVTFVDKWLGHFLDKLEKLGLDDNTIVMLISDHGTQLMDHGQFGKGPDFLRAYNTRVTWVVRHPDGPKGRNISGFVQTHDIFATALNLIGIPYLSEGQNAWQLVDGSKEQLRDHVVIGWAGWSSGNAVGRASVRDDDWNYVVSVGTEDAKPELYHLSMDPDENSNVVDKYPQVVEKQRLRLEAVIRQPLPGTFNEVCDPSPAPIDIYLKSRLKGGR